MDFDDADLVSPEDFNRILWKGIMGHQPYPAAPTGADLRQNARNSWRATGRV